MEIINFYSLLHLLLWVTCGKFLFKNWFLFWFLSLGWEVLELFLPFNFAIEILSNKLADIFINWIGFYLGSTILKND